MLRFTRSLWLLILIVVLPPIHLAIAQDNSTAPCSPAMTSMKPGTTNNTLQADGMERFYLLHIPPSYDPAKRTPLVFSLHGLASNAVQQALWSQWDKVADKETFVVVYPQATGTPTRWNAGTLGALNNQVDDIQFMRDLIKDLVSKLCVDPARIYVNGLSNGGGMSNRIACEMGDEVAAVGTVAGAYSAIPGGCNPSRPIPIIAFHGTADTIVPYDGRADTLPPVKEWVAGWARRNGCDSTPEKIPAKGDASGVHYQHCKDDADVIFYTIAEGGHNWPGGVPIPFVGKTSTDITASEVMWAFFKAHPLKVK